jgi:GntR family transcriptional regulator
MNNVSTQIANTKTIVSATNATTEDIELLNIKVNTPMLCFHNISTTADETIVDYAFAHYRGDLNKFEFDDSPKR